MNLEARIIGALRLAPMTAAQLAKCLSAPLSTTRHKLDDMTDLGQVRYAGTHRFKHGRPARKFAV